MWIQCMFLLYETMLECVYMYVLMYACICLRNRIQNYGFALFIAHPSHRDTHESHIEMHCNIRHRQYARSREHVCMHIVMQNCIHVSHHFADHAWTMNHESTQVY